MLDLTKPLQTRDGLKVRIIDSNFSHFGKTLILAILTDNSGNDRVHYYNQEGISRNNYEGNNLINIPIEQVMYGIVWDIQTFGERFFTTEDGRDCGFDTALGKGSARRVKVLVKEIE